MKANDDNKGAPVSMRITDTETDHVYWIEWDSIEFFVRDCAELHTRPVVVSEWLRMDFFDVLENSKPDLVRRALKYINDAYEYAKSTGLTSQ